MLDCDVIVLIDYKQGVGAKPSPINGSGGIPTVIIE